MLSPDQEVNFIEYTQTVVPSSMRSVYWKYFGFPCDSANNILTKEKIVCTTCQAAIAYNKNTSNLRTHLMARHPHLLREIQATKKRTKDDLDSVASQTVTPRKREFSEMSNLPHTSESAVVGDDFELMGDFVESEEVAQFLADNIIEYIDLDTSEAGANAQNAETDDELFVDNAELDSLPPSKLFKNSSNIEQIADMLVTDLLPLRTVNGTGLQQFLGPITDRDISNLCDKLDELYTYRKQTILAELRTVALIGTFSLSAETYTNVENLKVCNIYFHYYNKKLDELSSVCYVSDLEDSRALHDELKQCNLSNCTAVVLGTKAADQSFVSETSGIPRIECLEMILTDCLEQIFNTEIVSATYDKFFEQTYTIIHNDPAVVNKLHYCANDPWSKLKYVQFVADHLIVEEGAQHNILNEMFYLVKYMDPLKTILEITIAEEKAPVCSLTRPLVMQLFDVNFNASGLGLECAAEARKIILRELTGRVLEKNFLSEATFFDPRFQQKFLSLDAERETVKQSITIQFAKIINKTDKTNGAAHKSSLRLFFENLDEGDDFKESMNLRRNIFDVELANYKNESQPHLEYSPFLWWQERSYKYSVLSEIAEHYLTVPCCATDLYRKEAGARTNWREKRSLLRQFMPVEKYLWYLHYNKAFYEKLTSL